MKTFKVLIFFCFPVLAIQCTKKENPPPQPWKEWQTQLRKASEMKFGIPSITAHIYLKKVGDKAYVVEGESYPRLQETFCETCVGIERSGQKQIQFMDKEGQKVATEVMENAALGKESSLYVTPQYEEGEDKIRVFLHDLSLKDLDKKRQREFFGYDPNKVVQAKVELLETPKMNTIQRSDGSSKDFVQWGVLNGEVDGKSFELSLFGFSEGEEYKERNIAMTLYRDFSNGKSTYGAGRFLNVQFPKLIKDLKGGEDVAVDFNYSYNPPCATSTGFHCPLPQDIISTPLEVGEKYIKVTDTPD